MLVFLDHFCRAVATFHFSRYQPSCALWRLLLIDKTSFYGHLQKSSQTKTNFISHIKHFSLQLLQQCCVWLVYLKFKLSKVSPGFWVQVPPTGGWHFYFKLDLNTHTLRQWGRVSLCLKCQRSLPLIGPKKTAALLLFRGKKTKTQTDCKWALKRHDHIHFQRTGTSFQPGRVEEKKVRRDGK